jgi:hypothetical protein
MLYAEGVSPPEGLDSESKTVKVFLLFFLRVGPLLARCNFFCGPEMSRTQSEKSGQQRNDRQGTGKSINNANGSPKPQIVDQKNLSLIPLLEGATLGPVREGVGSQPKPGPSPPSVRGSTLA